MKKLQLIHRLGPEAVERVVRRFNDGELAAADAADILGVGRSRLYTLRAKWLSSGKKTDFFGASGGDRVAEWPSEAVGHLKTMILASKRDGPNYELYSDELMRKFGFARDRTSVRRFCEKNMASLLRSVFPIERKASPANFRRWECDAYGGIFQLDSTPKHIWGPPGAMQSIIIALDDASRRVMASRVCERETLMEHFAMLEQSFLACGLPEMLYTDGFTMFGKEGEDIKSGFGRMCRAFQIIHRIAPTPQAKGKIERSMRTFQHRLLIVLIAEGVDNEEQANEVAGKHLLFWNSNHICAETGEIPDARADRLTAAGKNRLRPCPDPKVLRLFLSRHEPRRVIGGRLVEFCGKTWKIAPTLKKTVWLAIRPKNVGFHVLETKPDPTHPVVPKVLASYKF